MNFGESIKILLYETGKTQQDLADSIGYSQRVISKWINNQAEPSERVIVACAYFFLSVLIIFPAYLLGHAADSSQTSNVYTHFSADFMQREAEKVVYSLE